MLKEIRVFIDHLRVHKEEGTSCGKGGGGAAALRESGRLEGRAE